MLSYCLENKAKILCRYLWLFHRTKKFIFCPAFNAAGDSAVLAERTKLHINGKFIFRLAARLSAHDKADRFKI